MVISKGKRMRTEHLVLVGRDKSNKWMADKEETSILLEFQCQFFEVGRLWYLVNVPAYEEGSDSDLSWASNFVTLLKL